ncbi:MAG: hypothetical protein DRN88_01835 [Candidatus Hydrothermarchaeota archaeon]|nr:MAG: hypothetical protein DRN88_01835 [Candidatus Hydrothermarchaeota archaeon]
MELMREIYLKYLKEIGGSIVSSENPCKAIKKARIRANITQEELGRLLGVRRETISRIECGHIFPTFEFVKNFSRILAVIHVLKTISGTVSSNFLSLYFNLPLKDIRLLLDIALRTSDKKEEVRRWK